MNLDKLKDKISGLSEAPGVYIFKDAAGKIIYIGKAKSLKKRVQSYFSRFLASKTQAMVSNIADIEYKLCHEDIHLTGVTTVTTIFSVYAALYTLYLNSYKVCHDVKCLFVFTKKNYYKLCYLQKSIDINCLIYD